MQIKTTCILILVAFCAHSSISQIVNIESSRMQSDTVGWMGGLGAAFSMSKNTEKILFAEFETHIQYKTSNDEGLWLLLLNFSFLKIADNRFISDDLLHLRYNRKVTEWLRWEFFGQYQNNVITQIDSRILLGTGPRFKLIKTEKFRLYTASLFMYEREKERTNPVISHQDIRNSSYLSFTWLPRENIEMISTTYYQPLLKNFNDYRILNQLVFKIKATPHFGLSVKWNYLFDRFPAGLAPKNTYSFATGISYDFKRNPNK